MDLVPKLEFELAPELVLKLELEPKLEYEFEFESKEGGDFKLPREAVVETGNILGDLKFKFVEDVGVPIKGNDDVAANGDVSWLDFLFGINGAERVGLLIG